jgi:maltose phosphorylase
MKNYLTPNPWNIIEEGFHPEYNRISESVFSLGNGAMGQRANFEEGFSGITHQGNYVAGVYYPDKTRVGWWKNGYPEYFAKVLNSANWIGIQVRIEGETLDLAKCEVQEFKRVLNMKEGYLERSFVALLKNGLQVKIQAKRFLSIVDTEVGAIRYSILPLNFYGKISISLGIDFDVKNEDANYDEKFWDETGHELHDATALVIAKTKKLDFQVCAGMRFEVFQNGKKEEISVQKNQKEKYAGYSFFVNGLTNEEIVIYKYGAVLSSENHEKGQMAAQCKNVLSKALDKGFDKMLKEQADAWTEKWIECDILIEGDIEAQQGIRFNIFQLHQTYSGKDARLNIGPKGFTGEKYGGSTYWDTEAYCLPFYLSTAPPEVTRNLLIYRYNHLGKAIENAAKLGFTDGAALYPMVTMNGEECHNEWEITFEEIHRNGAIAFAIYDYIRHTGDKNYLVDYGLEVLIAISRFWSQRISFSESKKQFVMLGVTGPNEYENNVNNNWYTSTIACWCLSYTQEALSYVEKEAPEKYTSLMQKLAFDVKKETGRWEKIVSNMYFAEDKTLGVFLQQEGYLDKEQVLVADLDPIERPLNQKWSWDRILRSCFIKQADVLQGLFLFEERFDTATIKRNFDFYEPRTVHESSLSPCIHSILAAKIGALSKAYEMYVRTARLDLDDYNNDTEDGCHITSMAGTWMSVVHGFGGLRIRDEKINLSPFLPEQWTGYAFKIRFRGCLLHVVINSEKVCITNETEKDLDLMVYTKSYLAKGKSSIEIQILKD